MSDEFEDFFSDSIDPTVNPAEANAQIAALLADETGPFAAPVLPDISFPSDGPVTLPGGYVYYDDEKDADVTVREAEVVELNGVAEEALAKSRNSDNPADYVSTLLRHGVATIGKQEATDEILDELLQGDRETLVLEIRKATYGDDLELGETVCGECEETFDLTFDLREVKVRKLRGDRQFDVKLRKGGTAIVRLPTGHDYDDYLAGQKTMAERNSILLARCVLELNGDATAGFPSMVREQLGVADRKKILKAISDKQPGPLYDEVTYRHTCGNRIFIPLGLMLLFQDL